jgi:hypothetical protein
VSQLHLPPLPGLIIATMQNLIKNTIVAETKTTIEFIPTRRRSDDTTVTIEKEWLHKARSIIGYPFTVSVVYTGKSCPRPHVDYKQKPVALQRIIKPNWKFFRFLDDNFCNMTKSNMIEVERMHHHGDLRNRNTIIKEEAGVLYIDVSTPINPDAIMLIDKDKWDWLWNQCRCRIFACATDPERKRPYAKTALFNANKVTGVHRLLLPKSKMVDHINHNGLDNRMCNLRAVTASENTKNISLQKNNTSGRIGVSPTPYGVNLWTATIKVNYKQLNLGKGLSFEEACRRREEAEKKYGFHENHGKPLIPD